MKACSAGLGHPLRLPVLGLLALSLSACITRPAPRAPARPARRHTSTLTAPHGRKYAVVPHRSQLTLLVYRTGPLAALGHNHVIDCRCMSGRLYVPRNVLATSFVLHIPVDELMVDEPALRAAEHSAAFPPDVSAAARRGTRHNMLSAAVLDAAAYPLITIRSARLRGAASGESGTVRARVRITVRGHVSSMTVPVHFHLTRGELRASGHFSLTQTALGLKPFSVLLGALRVRNRMHVRFQLVAVPTPTPSSSRPTHAGRARR